MNSAGITGPPASGKTTLWRAVTGGQSTGDVGTVDVPDPRLGRLAELEGYRKRVPVHFEFVDAHSGRGAGQAIARLRECDALVVVVPDFVGQEGTEPSQHLDELILADMAPFESRLARARKDPETASEVSTLQRALDVLGGGSPLSAEPWEARDLKVFSALSPLTLKPILIAHNVAESHVADKHDETTSIWIDAALEAEVSELSPEDATELLNSYGIEAPARTMLVSKLMETFDLITFFTSNKKEARAWELRRGGTALEAAGRIHSDMERGFIRAEVCDFEDLDQAGGWDAARNANRTRVEGKDYEVADGDVIRIRFSV